MVVGWVCTSGLTWCCNYAGGATVGVSIFDTCCAGVDGVSFGVVVVPGLYRTRWLVCVVRASWCSDGMYFFHWCGFVGWGHFGFRTDQILVVFELGYFMFQF